MTKPLTTPEPIDQRRLPDEQAEWIRAVISQYIALVESLSREEHDFYTLMWENIARLSAPVIARQSSVFKKSPASAARLVTALQERRLIWFDEDLQAVLQSPPYSVLRTHHMVKAFGWEKIYACSFCDIPSTLAVYGPNVWVNVQSTCPRSGEILRFRVRMRDDTTLEYDMPDETEHWYMWMPPAPPHEQENAYQHFNTLRSEINIFHTQEDLETHRQYRGQGEGTIYNMEQALYLGGLLAAACLHILRAR